MKTKERELEELKQKLSELRVFKGSVAIHSGDAWHDNNDFEQCEIDERRLLKQINDLSAEIASAEVIDDIDSNSNIVSYGARVLIKLSRNGKEIPEHTILFSDSDEPSEFKKVSANSPLGNAIYQKEEGYSTTYTVDSNVFNIKILKIEY
ncbi:MAG: GreA/GreB family elongation factor [Clostridia bacterium]|nr:GreA/GreB family elongation factor [Clostridia bacterium]